MVGWEECLFLINHITAVEGAVPGENSGLFDMGLGEKNSKPMMVETAKSSVGPIKKSRIIPIDGRQRNHIDIIIKARAVEANKVQIDVAVKSLAVETKVARAAENVRCARQARVKTIPINDREQKQIDVVVKSRAVQTNTVQIDVAVKSAAVEAKEGKAADRILKLK